VSSADEEKAQDLAATQVSSHSHPEVSYEIWHSAHDTQKVIKAQSGTLRVNLFCNAFQHLQET